MNNFLGKANNLLSQANNFFSKDSTLISEIIVALLVTYIAILPLSIIKINNDCGITGCNIIGLDYASFQLIIVSMFLSSHIIFYIFRNILGKYYYPLMGITIGILFANILHYTTVTYTFFKMENPDHIYPISILLFTLLYTFIVPRIYKLIVK